MSQETATIREHARTTEKSGVLAGGLGGLLAGIVFGLMMQMTMPDVITVAIPALIGLSGALAGWVVHLLVSVVFGALFGVAVVIVDLENHTETWLGAAALGITYGIAIWVVAASLVMPVWLDLVGFPGAPPVPNFDVMSLVGHAVYGLVLGLGYSLFRY